MTRSLEHEISRSIGEVLAAGDKHADDLRSDIAMVMREIDAGGTVFRAAIEAGDEELEREVLARFEALSAEFGDMAFMLADLARAAGEIQDSLASQGTELRTASEQVGRQSADVRMIREELAVIEQRSSQRLPEPVDPGPRRTGGCPYRGLLPYDRDHEAVFCGRERLIAELAGKLAGAPIVMLTGASGAGKTSLLQAGLVPALARGVQVPGRFLAGGLPQRYHTSAHRPGRRAGLAGRRGSSRHPADAGRRARRDPPTGARGDAGRARPGPAGAHHRPVRAGLRGRRAGREAGADGVRRRGMRGGDQADRVGGRASGPGGDRGPRGLLGPMRRLPAARPGYGRRSARDRADAGSAATAVAYSPRGKTLAAGYQDGTIRLWDIASHRLVSTASWGGAALALAFTGGGKTLEVAGPAAMGVWDLANEASIAARPLAGVTDGRSVAFSPDGTTLATGGDDGNVRLWDAATRQEIGAPMSSDLKPVGAVAFSPDGTTVAAASSDGMVQLWTVATQQEAGATMASGSAAIDALVFSPGGKFLAAGGDDGNVRLWDVATQSQAGATMATGAPVTALSFNAGGTTLATAESDGATELWAFATQQQTGAALAAQGAGSVSALAFSPSASVLAAGGGNGTIELWNPIGFHQSSAPIATGTPESPTASGGRPPAVFSHGDVLAVSDDRGTVRLWNAMTWRPIGPPIASHHTVTGLALSPDGKILALAADGLQLWSTATGQRFGGTLPAADAGGPVAFSPDSSLVAAIGTDGKARLWKVATQQEAGTAMTVGSGASQDALAFSPDGKIFATVSANGTAALWSVVTKRRTGALMTGAAQGATDTPVAGSSPVAAVAFSPDGTTLATAGASGSSSGSVRLWDTATRQEIGTPMTAAPARSTRSHSVRTAPRSPPLAPVAAPAAAPACGTRPPSKRSARR